MTEEEQLYIDHLKEEFYSKTDFKDCHNCQYECVNPKYKHILCGFINATKEMHVMNLNTNERYIY